MYNEIDYQLINFNFFFTTYFSEQEPNESNTTNYDTFLPPTPLRAVRTLFSPCKFGEPRSCSIPQIKCLQWIQLVK